MIVPILMLLLGIVLGVAGSYAGLVASQRYHEVPGVHRMHNEGPRLLVGDEALAAYWD